MRLRGLITAGAALALALGASPAGAYTGTGADVSWPQCGTALPAANFGVVGVNEENFATYNPCLATEFSWAAALGQPPQVYLLAADPGPGGTFWTGTGSMPCDLTFTAACAYDYGQQGAAAALTQLAQVDSAPVFVWVDIEGGAGGENWAGSQAVNNAEIAGELHELDLHPELVSGDGIYTSRETVANQASQLTTIAGDVGGLAQYPIWYATGQGGDASAACNGSTDSHAPVVLAQTQVGSADVDVACGPKFDQGSKSAVVQKSTQVTGTGEPNSSVSLAVRSASHVLLATLTVPVQRNGHWQTVVPFTQTATVTASTANGSSTFSLKPSAEVHITKKPVATGNCTAKVVGVTAFWWAGQTVQLKAGRTVVVKGAVKKAKNGGTWTLTVKKACGKGISVVPYVDGKAGKTARTAPSTVTKKTLVRVSN